MPQDPRFAFIIAWLVAYAVIVVAALQFRWKSRFSENTIIIKAGFGLGGVFELTKVLFSLLKSRQELMSSVDFDGVIVLTIGCAIGIVASIREISDLFRRPQRS